MPRRAVLYARVSADDRGRDGRNLAGQLDDCRAYALAQGWSVVAELSEDDRGASGASLDLPGLNRAISMARAGEFDVLVTRELDRLARGLAKQLLVEEELRRAGVAIEYVLGEYPDTPEGSLLKNVRAVIADYERLKINERMSRGRRQKIRAGNVMTQGPAPYGYRRAERDGRVTLEIVEEQARVVRQVYTWYVGPPRISLNAIVRRLSARGVPTAVDLRRERGETPRAEKKLGYGQWSKASLHVILKNETYAGTWHYGKRGPDGPNDPDTWLAVEVPAIVDRELWDAAQRQRRANRQHARRNTKHDYLLRRRLRCGACGRKLGAHSYHQRSKLYLYYRCDAHAQPERYGEPCDQKPFRAPAVDAAAWRWLRGLLSDPETLDAALAAYRAGRDDAQAGRRERLGILDDLLARHRARLDRLLELYLDGAYGREELLDHRLRLETTIADLERERRRLADELADAGPSEGQIADLRAFAAELALGLEEADDDFETRRALVDALDVEVTLAREDGEPIARISCVLGGDEALSVASNSVNTARRNPQPHLTLTARLQIV